VIRRTWAMLLAAAIFGMNGHAQVPTHQGLTFNGDGALRNNQIHWPKGFEPEQADLLRTMRSTSEPDARPPSRISSMRRLGPPGTRTRKTSRF